MGTFDTYPLTDESALDYDVLIALWNGIIKREAIEKDPPYCCNTFPHRAQDWYTGTVSAITATTLTDSEAAWTVNDLTASFGGGDVLPTSYDVIIDDCDQRKVVRAQISTNTATVLTISNITDYVTGKWIPSLASLVGKTYFIIGRSAPWYGGHRAYDRLPMFPNDQEKYIGTATGDTDSSGSYIEDLSASWVADIWTGDELLVYADDGLLKRVTIASNTSNRIYFDIETWVGSGSYSIVPTDNRCTPGKSISNPWKWYAGATQNYQGVSPTDTISASPLAATTIDIEHGEPPDCETEPVDALDVDVWVSVLDGCNPDAFYTLRYWDSLRALQTWLIGNCTSFVEAKTYTGEESIPNLTTATWFSAFLSGNSGTSTVAGTDPDYTFSVTRPYEGAYCWWTIKNADGSNYTYGYDAITGSNTVVLPDLAPEDVGKSVVWSYGNTRKHHRMFRRLHPQTCFIPSLDGTAVIDPPECPIDSAGVWTKRAASTNYAEVDDVGAVDDTGVAFVNGDYARLVGHNHNDGQIAGEISTTSYSADLEYQKAFHISQHIKSVQNGIDSALAGTTTGEGGTTWLKDTSKNWYSFWHHSGTMITHSGTATGGSATTLVTTGLTTSCFFDSDRFVGLDPFENFVLEFDKTDEYGTVTHKSRIVSISGNTFTIEDVGATPESGDAWRLVEPYEIQRYEGRTVILTSPIGDEYEATIVANGDDVLFFSAIAETVGAGWRYQIVEYPISTVFHRVAGEWIAETEQTEPTFVTKYGKQRKLDIVTYELINEIYYGIIELQKTKHSTITWSHIDSSDTEHNNQWIGGANYNDYLTLETWAEAQSQSETEWTQTTTRDGQFRLAHGYENDGNPPMASYGGGYERYGEFDQFAVGISRMFAYGHIGGLNLCLDADVDWYAYSTIDADNHDASTSGVAKYVFDNNSDDDGGAFQFRKWVAWSSTTLDAEGGSVSDACGNTDPSTMPTACAQPTYDTTDGYVSSSLRGYYIYDVACVLTWDLDD